MSSAKFVIVAVFALTLCSGVVAGMLVSKLPANVSSGIAPPPTTGPLKTPMAQALDLNPSQEQQMQKIWEAVRIKSDDCYVQAERLQHEQWQALVDLLDEKQKVNFNAKNEEFKAQFDELKKQRQTAFEAAVKQTDSILNESQQKQFHELVKERVGHGMTETPPWLSTP